MAVPRLRWAIVPNPSGDLDGAAPDGTAPVAWAASRPHAFGKFVVGNTYSVDFNGYLQLAPVGTTLALVDASDVPTAGGSGLTFSAGILSGTITGGDVTYTWNVIASFGGNDVPYGLFTVDIDVAPTISTFFPRMPLDYDSLTPYSGGKGMESSAGFPRDSSGTRYLYADDLGDNLNGSYDSGSRTGYGSLRWCGAQQTQLGWPNRKVIVLLRNGYYDIGGALRNAHDNTIICGQGVHAYVRRGVLGFRGFNHIALMHVAAYLGDDMSGGPAANSRDVINFGNANASAADVVGINLINCEFGEGMDEGGEGSYGLDKIHIQDTFWGYTYAFSYHLTDSVVTPPGTKLPEQHSAGPLIGGSTNPLRAGANGPTHLKQANFVTILRGIFAHNSIRNPKIYAKNVTIANTAVYNFGKSSTDDRSYNGSVATGGGMDISSCDSAAHLPYVDPTLWNVIACMFQRGPDNSNSRRFVGGNDVYKDGSQLYLFGNCQHGWSGITTQQQFASDQGSYPSGFYASSPIATARPGGYGNNFEFIRQIAANAPNPTLDERVAYYQALGARTGARPALRVPGYGRMQTVVDDMIKSTRGETPSKRICNSSNGTLPPADWNAANGSKRPVSPAVGSWQSIPNVLHTPTELGIPSFSEGRDQIQSSQLSIDGVTSLARRSKGEKALLDLHYVALGNQW